MELILIKNTKATTITLSVLFIFLLQIMTSASAGMKTFVKKEKFGCSFHKKQSKFIGTKAAIPKKYISLNLINILHNILVYRHSIHSRHI